jgi:hypothetical protein
MFGTDSMIRGIALVWPQTVTAAVFCLATPGGFPHNGRDLSGRRSSNLTRIQRHRLRRLLDEGRDLLSRERGREAADVFGRILLLDPENAEARRGLEQARTATVEAERVLATRLQEAEGALAAGEDEKARALLDEIVRQGGDRDRARDLLDRLDRRPGRLNAGRGQGTAAGEAEQGASAASPAWSRHAVIGGWVVVFGLLATGAASSWDRLLDRLGRAPSPSSQPAPPATSLVTPTAGERAVADARRLLEQGETGAALMVLDRIAPDEPAYPFARELRRQAENALLSGGRGR